MHDMTDKYVPSKNNKNLSLGQVKLLKVVIFLRSTMPYIAVFLIGHRLVVLLLNGSWFKNCFYIAWLVKLSPDLVFKGFILLLGGLNG